MLRAAMRCVVALNVRSGAGTCAIRLRNYLDNLNPDTVVLTERRDNAAGLTFASWAEGRGMVHATVTDGYTANGVVLASLDHFVSESATPAGQGAGCLMLVRFRRVTLLSCYLPQLEAKAAFLASGSANSAFRRPQHRQSACRSKRGSWKILLLRSFRSTHINRRTADLWRLTNGANRERTWLSPQKKNGFRIDHAFGNQAFVAAAGPVCTYDHWPRDNRLTNHSAIVVRISGGQP